MVVEWNDWHITHLHPVGMTLAETVRVLPGSTSSGIGLLTDGSATLVGGVLVVEGGDGLDT